MVTKDDGYGHDLSRVKEALGLHPQAVPEAVLGAVAQAMARQAAKNAQVAEGAAPVPPELAGKFALAGSMLRQLEDGLPAPLCTQCLRPATRVSMPKWAQALVDGFTAQGRLQPNGRCLPCQLHDASQLVDEADVVMRPDGTRFDPRQISTNLKAIANGLRKAVEGPTCPQP